MSTTIAERIADLSAFLVGKATSYQGERGKRQIDVDGIIVEVEFAGCEITNARGSWLGIRYRIKPKGKRAVWTFPTADEWGDLPRGVTVNEPHRKAEQ